MMAMNPGADSSTSSLPSGANRGAMLSKTVPLRRRRSKGTIAGFASGKEPSNRSEELMNGGQEPGDNVSSSQTPAPGPQHNSGESSSQPAKPCHNARLALMCVQNASRMGARTQLGLCPPGRARRGLQSASRTRGPSTRRMLPPRPGSASRMGESDVGGYYGLDKMLGSKQLGDYDDQEEDYLLSNANFDADSDEEASSGDEDELSNIEDLLSNEDGPQSLDDGKKYQTMREPLFTPAGGDPSVSNPNGAPMNAASSGKLPFNYRKIKYFDNMSAADRIAARSYLRKEARKCKQRDGVMLAKHLRRMQRRERRRILIEKGEDPSVVEDSDQENENPREQALLTGGVSQFPHPMTPSMSAALVLESLCLNPVESVEGMAKCYDGIVAAGVALLDSQVKSTSPLDEEEKTRPSRSEIMAALAPLLITSLEQASGEVILSLARLRRKCATSRYQRRFVQRVAPCLIRPPRGAVWCLRHQNDMEPILAAAELIFDSAFDVFGKGWYERGQLLLADSKRAKTLSAAAEQLKNLSTAEPDSLVLALGHGHRRNSKLMVGATPTKDAAAGSAANEPLAEWEVMAVDRQIRISISNIISRDWSRVVLQTRESEIGRTARRATTPVSRNRPAAIQPASAEASPKSIQPPRSPTRPSSKTAPSSPQSQQSGTSSAPAPESMESVFGPSFASQPPSAVVTAPSLSPNGSSDGQPPSLTPLSPPAPRRPALDSDEGVESRSPFTSPPHTPKPNTSPAMSVDAQTPPRSPKAASKASPPISAPKNASPMRTKPPPPGDSALGPTSSPGTQVAVERVDRAPLSPSTASIGSATSEIVPYRPVSTASSTTSVSSATSQTSNYRMLTSTAAERKRTVAACRALRAQISRFEEAFIQLHGRPPKGAAERAPLATTYAQYREWKRAIRADAACRIQALFRGARTRWILLRSNNPRLARVVMTRAGRSNFAMSGDKASRQVTAHENVLKQLSIPVEIGNEPDQPVGLTPMPGAMGPVPGAQPFNDVGVEVFINPSQAGGSGSQPAGLAPHWSASLPKRRPSNDPFPGPRSGSPPQFPSPSGFSTGSSSPGFVSELNNMSLPELQARKRELKQQLKQYDMKFARKHGRMPVKAEKEPIRHLYENYNALKTQINVMEQEAKQHPQTPGMKTSPGLAQRTPSPPGNVPTITDSSGEDSPSSSAQLSMARPKRKTSAKSPPPFEPPTQAASTPPGAPSQDLSVLKAEKGKLHQMLRSYEKDFFKEHKRQVSSFADIKPVASQYRRYKDIKRAIASLQQGGEK